MSKILISCIYVGIGGFVGSICRYLFGQIPVWNFTKFPVSTFVINFIGAFLIGLIVGATPKCSFLTDNMVLMLKVGLCGGFTTFSTLSLEVFQLMSNGRITIGITYMTVSAIICVFAVFLGQAVSKLAF